jgi:hypothetical protein
MMTHGKDIFTILKNIAFIAVAMFLLQSLGCGSSHGTHGNFGSLTSLLVNPPTSSIALGQTVQFKAMGIFSDGSNEDLTSSAAWVSSDPRIATVDSTGLATTISNGTVRITATSQGHVSSSVLAISKPALVSVAISPLDLSIALGDTKQLTATGTFSDKSTQDLTSVVTWTSSLPAVAVVGTSGLAASHSVGTSTITASLGPVNASLQLTVSTPALASITVAKSNSAIPLGATTQLTATGTYTDSTVRDLTNSVSWTCSPSGSLKINGSGVATGSAMGTATVTAKSGAISGASTLEISAPVVASIRVTPDTEAMPIGSKQQLTAVATFTDGSTRDLTASANWSSTSGGVVSVNSSGLAVANQLGSTAVFAEFGAIKGSAALTVSPAALASVSISPANPTMPLASNQQLVATGYFTDGSVHDVTPSATWTVDNPTIATVTGTGVAYALQSGTTSVESSVGGVVGSTVLTVQPMAAVGYFTHAATNADVAVRVTNTGSTGQKLCVMTYVFDQDQQMAECCGCMISPDGLRTFSLRNDFISNPLTGVSPVAGSIMMVPSDYSSNPACDASSISPSGLAVAWSTHLQSGTGNQSTTTEEPLSSTPLGSTLSSSLQAQCKFIQLLGSGHGACGCGTGD